VRILILGGDGMLGHRLLRGLAARHEVRVTLRRAMTYYAPFGLFTAGNAIDGVEATQFETVERALDVFAPKAVVNAVGIVKQRAAAKDAIASIEVNSLFPHRLALTCASRGARLVHLSTDCVFSGRKGTYTEADTPDAADLYGRSKLLGELDEPHCLTLRTSIIGLELVRDASLVEWYLAQRGTIRGFDRAIYSGFTTAEMTRIIERLLVRHGDLSGVWHVASAPISKYSLLSQLTAMLRRTDIVVERDDSVICDRSLDGSRFAARTGYRAPPWEAMLTELAGEISEQGNIHDLRQ
jgi:dTDP-4-dehydrorhamnose reductase